MVGLTSSGTRHASSASCAPWPLPILLLPKEYFPLLSLLGLLFPIYFAPLFALFPHSFPHPAPAPPTLPRPFPAPLAPPFLRETDRMEQRDFFSVGLATLARYSGNDSSWTVDRLITETCSNALASFHTTSSVRIPFLPSLAHTAES